MVQTPAKDPQLLGFWRRVLQVHLCFVYLIGGLSKCLGSGWWDGTNLWRALSRPPFNTISPDVLVRFKYVLVVLGISICLIEVGYPFFIWMKKTRFFWLICILAMHVTIGLTMGLYLFALIMVVLNLAAFGPDFGFGRRTMNQEDRNAVRNQRTRGIQKTRNDGRDCSPCRLLGFPLPD
jgi:hypothetical protein